MVFCCMLLTIFGVKGVIICTSSFYHMSTPPLTLLMTPLTSLPLQPQFVSFQTLYFHDCAISSNVLFLLMTPHLSLRVPAQPQEHVVKFLDLLFLCIYTCT